MVDVADVSETGSGTEGVEEASTLTVAVVAVGAVQARALQSHDTVLIVMPMVESEPEFVPQSAKVVVIVKVSVTVDEIWLPYYDDQ